jgi:hypothetical protein
MTEPANYSAPASTADEMAKLGSESDAARHVVHRREASLSLPIYPRMPTWKPMGA